MFVRQQLSDGRLHPGDTVGQHVRQRATGLFNVVGATADQGPGRLVTVVIAGFDKGDIQVRVALEQAGQQADACRTAADDDDIATDGWAPVLVGHGLLPFIVNAHKGRCRMASRPTFYHRAAVQAGQGLHHLNHFVAGQPVEDVFAFPTGGDQPFITQDAQLL